MSANSFPVVLQVPHLRVVDLLISGIEQAVGMWSRITEESEIPPNISKYTKTKCNYFKYFCGGWTQFTLLDPETGKLSNINYTLNLNAIRSGFQVMADKYPDHLANWIKEEDDAITGNVFLQCCLFKEVIYG